MNQKTVAMLLGITSQAVHAQEKDGVRTVNTAKRYAAALKCNPLEILELE